MKVTNLYFFIYKLIKALEINIEKAGSYTSIFINKLEYLNMTSQPT